MSRDKSLRVRKESRHNSARSGNTTNEPDTSEHSFESEPPDRPKSTSTPLKSRERTTSSSSVKSSRRQSIEKLKISDGSENEEAEGGDTTYTKYDESGSNDQNDEIIDSVRKVEDFLMSTRGNNNDIRDDTESSDDKPAKREKRRKSKKQRREKSRNLDSNRTDDDEAYDEDHRSSERDQSRSRTKKLRANVPRKSRRKRRRSKGDSSGKTESQEKELPITEILRKAQENPKKRYEEPQPLAELTTDRIYVQRRNGFSAIKISGARRNNGIFGRRRSREQGPPLYPIKVAIVAQKIWNSTGFIHQGLLAGMALMHFLLIQTFFQQSLESLEDYSLVSEYYANIFSYLVTMSVISAFDRFDLAQLNIEHFREIYAEHSRSVLAIPLYIATFSLHQTNLLVDDNISLIGYSRNTTGFENNFTSIVVEENLVTWRKVALAKDSLAVLAWLFVALGPREDMLLSHLKAMEKYVETPEISG